MLLPALALIYLAGLGFFLGRRFAQVFAFWLAPNSDVANGLEESAAGLRALLPSDRAASFWFGALAALAMLTWPISEPVLWIRKRNRH